jgi:hypothetical protein
LGRLLWGLAYQRVAGTLLIDPPWIEPNQVKVFGWYDNEWAFSNRLVELSERIAAAA